MKPLLSHRSFWRTLGPGVLLAATAIGASHLVLAPQAGARFGLGLLWLVPLAHLLKYPAFEFGPRYAAAQGESLLVAYGRVPGPRNWALWAFLASTVMQGTAVLAGVAGIAAAVAGAYLPGAWTTTHWAIVVLAAVVGLLAGGGFSGLDRVNKVMMAVLVLATAAAALGQPAPAGTWSGLIAPQLPPGSLPLAAAILGWMPTGLDVSVWHSLWTVEKQRRRTGERITASERRQLLRLSLADMRLGYVLSVVVALVFVVLGAAHLQGRGDQLLGAQFPRALADVYGTLWGSWMYHLFFIGAFFAMFSTSYTVMDGFSRSFSEAVSLVRPALVRHRRRLYWGFVLVSSVVAAATLATVGNPVRLVLLVAVVSLCFAPVLYGLNTWIAATQITDRALRPSRALLVLALVGTIAVAAAAVGYVVTR